jgi:hypothetical protein
MGGVPRHSMAVFDKDVLATASYDRVQERLFMSFSCQIESNSLHF